MSILDEVSLNGRRKLPMVLAAEGAECGLACLVMIGVYHGHDIDLNGMRQRYSLSLAGANLRNIMELAGQLGFSSRPLRVELEHLRQVKAPAILHWGLNHFVVLRSAGKNGAVVHDPVRGVRKVSIAELSDHFTGVVLELDKASDFGVVEATAPVRIRSLWSDSRGLWNAGVQILVLSFALQLVTFVAPLQMQLVVDEAIGRGDRELLTVLAWGFGGILIIQALLGALRTWVMQVVGTLFSFQLVGNIVRHLLRLPSPFFEKRHLGDILSRMGSSAAIQDALTRGVVAALIDGVMALVAGVILFVYSPLLAWIVIGSLLISLAVTFAYYPILRARNLEKLYASAKEQSYLMETVRAATTIKVMGRGPVREAVWRNLYATATSIGLQTAKYNVAVGLFQGVLMGAQSILVLYLAARMVIGGDGFSVGMLMAFVSYRTTFSDRVIALINQTLQFRMLGLHLERLSDIISAQPEASPASVRPIQVAGAISVRGVSFRYGDPDPWVLKDLNLEVAAGDYLAITGSSGSGKSTLLKLLLGLQTPTSGEVTLDGQRATPELWAAWRQKVGVVSQSDNLLSGSIADNIAFFDPELDMNLVQKAAESAHVHAEIKQMPMEYLTSIGDMGSTLSGGQRQRILLARALYRQPEVLFLDEGTANLDEATEEAIAELLVALPITRIIVAHRPALIQRAHRVAIMEHGGLRFIRGGQSVVTGVL